MLYYAIYVYIVYIYVCIYTRMYVLGYIVEDYIYSVYMYRGMCIGVYRPLHWTVCKSTEFALVAT